MEYYRTLNLEREPFSNSPDPGLFYESKQHLEALQQLEISIRLKRGLNVVTGEVGTGKTTISRQLIQKITHDPDIQYALILDPGFISVSDFLACVLKFFTNKTIESNDENDIKEEIKNYLFFEGVEKKRTLVLIIDEGQKLPVFCLEVLRELLNYETNDQKLLQIVIFAQKEFDFLIEPLENFKDRINFQYSLKPLGLNETKGLIKYRLSQSVEQGNQPPSFSFFAYYSVFKHTKGYPRKIINICHHIILALIVADKNKADYYFVRNCAHKVFLTSNNRVGLMPLGIAAFIILSSMYFFNFPDFDRLFSKARLSVVQTSVNDYKNNTPQTDSAKSNPTKMTETFTNDHPVQLGNSSSKLNNTQQQPMIKLPETIKASEERPQIYGRLKVTQDDTLYDMVQSIYGTYKPVYVRTLLSVNEEIDNPDLIQTGTMLRFPIIEKTISEWDKKSICILLDQSDSFYSAYLKAREYDDSKLGTRILHALNEKTGFVFYVVVNRFFDTQKHADTFKNTMPEIQEATNVVVGSIISGRQ